MSQYVPSWDVDDNQTRLRFSVRGHSNSNSFPPDFPMLDYEVAELRWENGQPTIHGLGPPRLPNRPPVPLSPPKYTWEEPHAGGTQESIVNQGTRVPHCHTAVDGFVPWLDNQHAVVARDALPLSPIREEERSMMLGPEINTCVVGSSPHVGSCSGAATFENRSDD